MTVQRPFIEIAVNGRPVGDLFYQALVEAVIVDAPGQENDRLDVTFDDDRNQIETIAKGDRMSVFFGFEGADQMKMGQFVVDSVTAEGGQDGEFLIVTGHAADLRADMKEPQSESFDNTSIGAIVREVAGRHGMQAVVSAELDGIAVPYELRLDQSAHDFLTRLADRYGGIYAPKDGRLAFLKPGGADDAALAAAIIDKADCARWSISIEPRPAYGEAEAGWFDRDASEMRTERAAGGQDGPVRRLRHPFAHQDQSKAAAAAEIERQNRKSGSGFVTLSGRPDIRALSRLWLTGFRPEHNGLWRADEVEHTYADTYTTTPRFNAGEDGKR